MATCGFRLHPSRTSRFTQHAAGIEMLRWRLPPCESALAVFSRNCALTLTTMFHRKDHQFTEKEMRERHGSGRSEKTLSRTEPSQTGPSRTDPSQMGLSGTDPNNTLVRCAAHAVDRACHVSECVLLGRALADFSACSSACTFDAMNYAASAAQVNMSTSIHFTARVNK